MDMTNTNMNMMSMTARKNGLVIAVVALCTNKPIGTTDNVTTVVQGRS
jgi:hypothetical protein